MHALQLLQGDCKSNVPQPQPQPRLTSDITAKAAQRVSVRGQLSSGLPLPPGAAAGACRTPPALAVLAAIRDLSDRLCCSHASQTFLQGAKCRRWQRHRCVLSYHRCAERRCNPGRDCWNRLLEETATQRGCMLVLRRECKFGGFEGVRCAGKHKTCRQGCEVAVCTAWHACSCDRLPPANFCLGRWRTKSEFSAGCCACHPDPNSAGCIFAALARHTLPARGAGRPAAWCSEALLHGGAAGGAPQPPAGQQSSTGSCSGKIERE